MRVIGNLDDGKKTAGRNEGDMPTCHGRAGEDAFQSEVAGKSAAMACNDRFTCGFQIVRRLGNPERNTVPSFQQRKAVAIAGLWQRKIFHEGRLPYALSVAEIGLWCKSAEVKTQMTWLVAMATAICLPAFAQEVEIPPPREIPADLLDDPHVREELAVNEFTAPSISKLFDTLQFLMPLPIADNERKMPARMPLDRADLAIELGFLIADGFLVVQAGQMEKVEELASDLTRYGKALGAGDRVNRHAAALLDSAKKQNVEQLKKELAATQRDVEIELVTLKDTDLAHLISLGGWIRALEVSTIAVERQFSAERARKVMREDIADYYTESVAGLEPRISERPNYLEMRDVLSGLRSEMLIEEGNEPDLKKIIEIREQAAKLVKLALQRQEG